MADLDEATSLPENPYGVKPLGNIYADQFSGGFVDARGPGLGQLSCLPETLLLDILASFDGKTLCKLAQVSRAMYVYTHYDDLWRSLVLSSELPFEFQGHWKAAFVNQMLGKQVSYHHNPIHVDGFYSDILHKFWICANVPVMPQWHRKQTIPRAHAPTLDEFVRDYELPNKPVILTGVIEDWPALKRWTPEQLCRRHADLRCNAAGYYFRLEDYFRYAAAPTHDQPLYLFDKRFANNAPDLEADFKVPVYFRGRQDLFHLLDLPDNITAQHSSNNNNNNSNTSARIIASGCATDQSTSTTSSSASLTQRRPDYRWIIAGPARSGSTFHKDPNGTSAWNAVVSGRKHWIMFPPDQVPPGVHASTDEGDVATPPSVMEWYYDFYPSIRYLPQDKRPLQGSVGPGEVMFVPAGWWHAVLNLEQGIAITQNVVSPSNLPSVLQFIDTKRDQVSGVACERADTLYEEFVAALERHEPELLAQAEATRPDRLAEEQAKREYVERTVSRPWRDVLAQQKEQQKEQQEGGDSSGTGAAGDGAGGGGGFSFGFQF